MQKRMETGKSKAGFEFVQFILMATKKKNTEADNYYPASQVDYVDPSQKGSVSNAKVANDKVDLSNPKLAVARDGNYTTSTPSRYSS